MRFSKLYLLSFTLIILLSFNLTAQDNKKNDLKWYTWNEGYKLAQENGKIVLIDMYTDWCGWCKKMDRDTYSKPEVVALINKHFVPIKFNPELANIIYDVDGTKVNGRQLQGMLTNGKGSGYPTTFFIFTETKMLYPVSGYQNAERFLATLQSYVNLKKTK